MTFWPPASLKSAIGWEDLVAELDRWEAAGREARLWWRDDDATEPTAALERLLELADGLPVALCVIPARTEAALLRLCKGAPHLFFLQHGWRHENHAQPGGKKSEFPRGRPPSLVAEELAAGRARLASLFGSRALPVLVPPWNRLDKSFLPLLPACGITALSGFGPRRGEAAFLIEVNTHIDLVAWKGDRGFIGEEAALGGLLRNLAARRGVPRGDGLPGPCRGEEGEAAGILTHHLVQTRETDSFLDRLFTLTRAHPAVRWLAANEVFARPAAAGP
jgi:hypothetical protein